jgi:diadenosine tetraphosphatase ApaH/serine/threonine PP2A family protein phosphatase
MRNLIISDIHANLTALEAVLTDAGEFEAVWCLGDIVGYGPDPNECVARIRQLPNLACILGNHDAAALGQIDPDTFNPEARQAIEWTQEVLTDSSLAFLQSLPERLDFEEATLAHGSPRHPVWEYLLDTQSATLNFDYFGSQFCFVGHTHLPVIFSMNGDQTRAHLYIPEPNSTIKMEPRAIINPGSVGQPRDRDPRAAYAIFDTETAIVEHHRIEYEIQAVQARMLEANLPERHIQRLSTGW